MGQRSFERQEAASFGGYAGYSVDALDDAVRRDIRVYILLGSSKDESGSLHAGPIAMMREAVSGARTLAWTSKPESFMGGRVHARIAVADHWTALVSSANLTGHALTKNMEAGLLGRGEDVPGRLHDHLLYLVSTGAIEEALH